MLLLHALFPTPYADASTNFDVLRIQQPVLNTHRNNALLAQHQFS